MRSFLLWHTIQALEVATFPSGHSVLRLADLSVFKPHLARFSIGIVTALGRNSSTYKLGHHVKVEEHASIVLYCPTDASPPQLRWVRVGSRISPPIFHRGEVYGEIRWFLDWLGVRVLMKDDWDDPRWASDPVVTAVVWGDKAGDRVDKVEPVVGTPLFPADEAEIFALLGNPVPFLWPAEAFARWADDLRESAAPSPPAWSP